MNSLLQQMLDFFRGVHRRNGRRRTVLTALACVVVFATTYALILPAITLDEDTASETPGVEVQGQDGDGTAVDDVGVADSGNASQGDSASSGESGSAQGSQGNGAGNDANAGGKSSAAHDADDSDGESPAAGSLEGEAQQETDTGTKHYRVKATYGEDAGIPGNATLQVKVLDQDSQDGEEAAEFSKAKDAVVNANKADDDEYDETTLGITALDISIVDADGNAVEPTGKVDVKIDLPTLPDEALQEDNYDVQHIVDTQTARENGVEDVDKKATDQGLVAETVAEDVKLSPADSKTTAEFTTTSFSTYTVTWTKDTARIGYVTIHYVNGTGGVEVTNTSRVDAGEMAKSEGDVVDVSTWANDANGNSRVEGYTFAKATVGSRTGTQITGLKVSEETTVAGSTAYRLFYTTIDDPTTTATDDDWTAYKDSASGNEANNADVFLFYDEDNSVPITVHFMNTDFQAIRDASGNDLTATVDATTFAGTSSDRTGQQNGSHDFAAQYVQHNVPDGYTFNMSAVNTSSNANKIYYNASSPSTSQFRYLNYYDTDGAYRLYWGRGSGGWTAFDTNTPDLYVTFALADSLNVTVHRIDAQGNAIGDTTLTVGDGGTVTLDDAGTVKGYTPSKICYAWDADSTSGTDFTTLAYSKGSTAWTSNADGTDTDGPVTEVWAIYDANASMDVTVHHVNAMGTEIAPATSRTVKSGEAITADSLDKASGRTSNYTYATYFLDGSDKTGFASITYSCDANGDWSSTYQATAGGDETSAAAPTDLYLTYTPTTDAGLIVHYVDESGGVLHAQVTAPNGAYTGSTYDGWTLPIRMGNTTTDISGVGTYQHGFLGAFGQNQIPNGSAAMYKLVDGVWHTGIGVTSNKADYDADTNPNGVKEVLADGESALLTDLYYVYGGDDAVKGVTVHHVDEQGNKVADDTYATSAQGAAFTASSQVQIVQGYGFKDAHFGSYGGTAFDSLTFTYDSTQSDASKRWSSTYTSGTQATAASTGETAVNEVWLVYEPGATFTAHYVDGDADSLGNATFSVGLTGSQGFQSGTDLIPETKARLGSKGSGTVTYSLTRLGAVNGPAVNSVEVDDSGNVIYHYTTTTTLALQRDGRWGASDASGRTFTLEKRDDGYTLIDSQEETASLSLQSGAADDAGAVYAATFHGDNVTVEYTVTKNDDGTFTLSLEDSIPSASRDVYVIYEGGSEGDKSIWINDDLAYSGLFKTGFSEALQKDLTSTDGHEVSDVVYTWHRVTSAANGGDDAAKTDTVVTRKLTGDDYNMAYDATDRTWLDVAADEGDDIWTASTHIAYYVTVDYKVNGEQQPQIKSDEQDVNYYGRLENGSFEIPDLGEGGGTSTSNANYKSQGGVWQTTGPDSNTSRAFDIEIINSGGTTWNAAGYNWYESSFNNPSSFTSGNVAADGHQFAELNAENAGALYQDVITHPDEQLSYGLSHRARGKNRTASAEYDTMYLVIMPTSLAMTSGSDGGELKTQADLEQFINDHGGYRTSAANAEEDEVIWQDYDTGILIRRISSSDQAWHAIDVANGYMATTSLTRFFFVAGPTAADQGRSIFTQGNFLDDVYFTQQLPETTGFNLTVTKTFTGLSQEEVAGIASTFEMDVSNANTDEGVSAAMKTNDALSGAKLSFTATQTGQGTYNFTPTATGGTLTSGNSRVDGNGNVVLTWTFADQPLQVGTTSAQDQTFAYTVSESGTDIDGRSVTSTGSATVTGGRDSTATGGSTSATANVTTGATAAFAFTNAYRDNSQNDAPQVTVRKVFSGATRATVDKLLSSSPGYSVTLTKTADADGSSIGDPPSLTLNANTAALPSNVSFAESEDGSGRVVLTWTVTSDVKPGTVGYSSAMGSPGTYTVQEAGFTPTAQQVNGDNNKLTSIEVNGSTEGVVLAGADGAVTTDYASASTATKKNLGAGGDSAGDFSVASTSNEVRAVNADVRASLDTATNIVIAKTNAAGNAGYLVWTADTLGVNARQAVVNFINATEGLGAGDSAITATLGNDNTGANVNFRSGANPGTLTYGSGTGSLAFTYDSASGALSLKNQPEQADGEGSVTTPAASWTAYYAGTYTLADGQQSEFRVANIYDPIVKIAKTSTDSPAKSLSGAVFRLYKLDADGETRLYYTSKSTQADPEFKAVDVSNSENTVDSRVGDDASRNGEVKALSFTTGSDGIVSIGALPKGPQTYYLEEVTAPDGYGKVADIAFTVGNDGTVALVGPNDDQGNKTSVTETTDATVTWNDPYYTITVKDSPGAVLPNTGGAGVKLFMTLGLFAVIVSAGAFWLRRQRAHAAAVARYGLGGSAARRGPGSHLARTRHVGPGRRTRRR